METVVAIAFWLCFMLFGAIGMYSARFVEKVFHNKDSMWLALLFSSLYWVSIILAGYFYFRYSGEIP
jgi:hypothetical protein